MKRINIVVLLLLSMAGFGNLSAVYPPSTHMQIFAYLSHEVLGAPRDTDSDILGRRPTAILAFHAKGSPSELRKAIADKTGVNSSDIGNMYRIDGGRKTLITNGSSLSGAKHVVFELRSSAGAR